MYAFAVQPGHTRTIFKSGDCAMNPDAVDVTALFCVFLQVHVVVAGPGKRSMLFLGPGP